MLAKFSVMCSREIRKFHVVQRSLKNVQKSVLLFLPFFLLSPSLLPKLPFVAIQTFCHHGDVTSHLSSLVISNYLLNLL